MRLPTFSVGQISVFDLYGRLCVAVVNAWRYDIVKLQLHTIKMWAFKSSFPKNEMKMIWCIFIYTCSLIDIHQGMYDCLISEWMTVTVLTLIFRNLLLMLLERWFQHHFSFTKRISANGKRLKALFSKIKK